MGKEPYMIINWHKKHADSRTFGERLADSVAQGMGSWTFIIIQSIIVIMWMALNVVAFIYHWDEYPFILLNLVFSTQAAYAAPIIMMSQNRSSDRDRQHAEVDYKTNVQAKKDIEDLMKTLHKIDVDKLDKIISLLDKEKS
jgi:uncharacterized membrane protein